MSIESNDSKTNVRGQGASPLSSATTATNGAMSGVSREPQKFLSDIEDVIKATTPFTGEDLARAKDKLSASVTAAKQSVEKIGSAIADRARSTATATDSYVHEQPWRAIGLGAGLGVLIGFILARRR